MNILYEIKDTANRFPDRAAIISGDDRLSYAELDRYSDLLAVSLQKLCKNDRTPIPVYGHKSSLMLICFLACVKSGRCYCPIDISVPWSRTMQIIENIHPPFVLACEDPDETEQSDSSIPFINKTKIQELIHTASDESISDLVPVSDEDLFYMIFTSGSTGTPKGVQITANCLNNYLDWSVGLGTTKEEKEGTVFLNQAPFSFDLSVMDLYTCLACGGTLYPLTKSQQSDFRLLLPALAASDASVWVSTPSFADMCLRDPNFDSSLLPQIRLFLFCGETLTNRTAEKLSGRFPDAVIMNTYGPTESTVAVTEVEVTPELIRESNPLPVGRPKSGTWIEIHSPDGARLTDGEKGEIVILGNTVSPGYYKRPDLSSSVFFVTVKKDQTVRGYRTGDEGYMKNGQLYYCGRMDLQIKLHGYRIELGDIESNLLKLPGIKNAAAVANMREGTVKSITAFLVPESAPEDTFAESLRIKQELKNYLPDYMIPKKLVFLDQIPMTANGKADRKALGGILS